MFQNNTQTSFTHTFTSPQNSQCKQDAPNNSAGFMNNLQQTNQRAFSDNNSVFNKPNSNQGLFTNQQSFNNASIINSSSQGFSTHTITQQGFFTSNNTAPFNGNTIIGDTLGGNNTINSNNVIDPSIGGANPIRQTNIMGQTEVFGQNLQTVRFGQTSPAGGFGQTNNQRGFNQNNPIGNLRSANMGISNGTAQSKLRRNLISQDLAFQTFLENIKIQLEECSRVMISKNLESIHLDSRNTLKDKSMNKLPHREQCLSILYNFHELKKNCSNIKKSNQEIEKAISNISKNTHEKLALYKRCLLQTVSHNKLIQELSGELQLMDKEIQDYFKPLYNSFKYKTKASVKQPNEFDLKISYDVLNKLQIFNQRVDDMIACQSQVGNQQFQSTISIFEHLIEYYQNVSCSFKQFSGQYNSLKKQAIERSRQGPYQTVMNKVVDKVNENLKREFKYYDLMKQIDEILIQKDKREQRKRIENEIRYQSKREND